MMVAAVSLNLSPLNAWEWGISETSRRRTLSSSKTWNVKPLVVETVATCSDRPERRKFQSIALLTSHQPEIHVLMFRARAVSLSVLPIVSTEPSQHPPTGVGTLRAELRMAEPREPSPEVEAFFARNVRPGGPLAPDLPRKR